MVGRGSFDEDGELAAEQAKVLRRQIAEKACLMEDRDPNSLGSEETRLILHELQVHQIELEMQNEELHRIQHELKASRESYINLYDYAPVAYFTVSEAGLIIKSNLTASTLLGIPRGELDKHALSHFILSADQDSFYKHRKQLYKTDKLQNFELRLLRSDGSAFWALLEMSLCLDGNIDGAESLAQSGSESDASRTEKPRFILVSISDINERKVLEIATRQLASIVESSEDAIVSTDLNANVLTWNLGAERLFGYKLEEMIGKSILLIIPAEQHKEEMETMDKVKRGQKLENRQTIRLLKGGELIEISLTVSPILDSCGKIVGASRVARDITAWR